MTDPMESQSLDFTRLRNAYRSGDTSAGDVVALVYERIAARGEDGVWICVVPRAEAEARAAELDSMPADARAALPLFGLPFGIKDCIDVAGMPTTAACPTFSYMASATNPTVARLLDAGAILIGKTNLDQFATGLVGIRTPYTIPGNAFDSDYIPGGSSPGSGVAVAAGLVSFSLGTDVGGSGRVPAACNNVVGLKPTCGLLSETHAVPACRSVETISVFALTCEDAREVLGVVQAYDPEYPFSRRMPETIAKRYEGGPFRFAVPWAEALEFFGNDDARRLYADAVAMLADMGGTRVDIDFAPFQEAGGLLFDGPWVAERYAEVGKFVEAHADQVLPTTRDIILGAKRFSASDYFEARYRLEAIRKQLASLWSDVDILVLPATGTIYRIDEVQANPVELNTRMGYYTYFVNLLDLAAVVVPNGFYNNGLPAGVSFNAPAFSDDYLLDLGASFHRKRGLPLGATGASMPA